MFRGHIKVWRKITEWEWYTKNNMLHIFLHLLLKANYTDKRWRGIDIKRGQYWTSLKQLSTETGISEQSVRTALKNLELSGELTSKPTNEGRLLTLNNYEIYNMDEKTANKRTNKQTNKPLTNDQQTPNKPLTTTNKDNKEKEGKELKENNIYIAPLNLPSKDTVLKTYLEIAVKIFADDRITLNKIKANEKAIDFLNHWVGDEISRGAWITEKKYKGKKINLESTIKNNILYIGTNGVKFNYEYMANYDVPYKEYEPEKTPEELAEIEKKSQDAKKKIAEKMEELRVKYANENIETGQIDTAENKKRLNEILGAS